MVLRILPVTLVPIDIAILKILEQTWKLSIFVTKILPIESQNRKTPGDLFKVIFLRIFSIFRSCNH